MNIFTIIIGSLLVTLLNLETTADRAGPNPDLQANRDRDSEDDDDSEMYPGANDDYDDSTEESPSAHIVGGKTAYLGQFKYQASILLSKTKQHHCGAAIISKSFLLSAAHCFRKRKKIPSIYFIKVGSVSLYKKGGMIRKLAKFVMHEGYNRQTKMNDIALIKTKKPIVFSATVQPIKIFRDKVPPGETVVVSGWGMLDFNTKVLSKVLQYIKSRTISPEECKRYIRNVRPDVHLCTRKLPNTGFCKGDSGGPLAYKQRLVGLVSFALACADRTPDVYVRVAQFEDWIKSTARTLGGEMPDFV